MNLANLRKPYRTRALVLASLAVHLWGAAACKPGETSTPTATATTAKSATPNQPSNTTQPQATASGSGEVSGSASNATPQTQVAGTLAVDTGTVALNIKAVSSAHSFDLDNAQAASAPGLRPGSLAVAAAGLALDDTSGPVSPETAPDSHAFSIASGAPDGFKITLVNIALGTDAPRPGEGTGGILNDPFLAANAQHLPGAGTQNSSGSGQQASAAGLIDGSAARPLTVFDKPEGVTVSIDSGVVDLGALVGNAAQFTVPTGTYRTVKISVKRRAEIKGCVSGDFVQPGGPVSGSANVTGLHTYCTVPGFTVYDDAHGTNAAFEDKTAQFMPLDLDQIYAQAKPPLTDTLTFTFPLTPALVVAKGESVDLSLVFDLNRMLRYYNQNRVDQGAGPNDPVDRTFFFTSVFNQSFYAFVGNPGRVYGYQLVARNCAKDLYDAAAKTCNGSAAPSALGAVGGWMTIITSPTGAPLVINLMPNDDNDFTIIKGNIAGVSPFLEQGSAPGRVDVHYALGDQTGGTVRNFDPDLDATAVGSPMNGVSFDATHPNGAQTGPLYVVRRL